MNVLFVYPSLADSGFSTSPKEAPPRYIHHGFCYLSSCAKEAGYTTELIDLRVLTGWDELSDKIRNSLPQVVAITMMSPDYSYVIRAADIIKSVNRATKIIVGGIHPTVMPHELESNENMDYVVRGEGETVFVELLDNIRDGSGISEKVITGEKRDVNNLPFIDRYLFDCLEYPFDSFLPLPFFTIMAGRGCSYNCKFCAPAGKLVHGKGSRRRSVRNVMEELKLLKDKYGMGSFMFHDDCFTEDKSWVLEFCAAYKKERFCQDFICQSRADIITRHPDMIHKLAETGLRMMMIGFESGNDRVLGFIGKGVTLKQNLRAAAICKRNGIRVWALHMFGLPTETNREAWDTVRMIKRIRPYRSSAAFFTPHPGSYLHDYCKSKNLLLIDDHDDFVAVPEHDKPKIKGIDYDFMKKAAMESKKLPFESRLRIKLDRIFRCRRNRRFLRIFREIERTNPNMHKLDILSMMKTKYPHA